jgi:hypothetical protein
MMTRCLRGDDDKEDAKMKGPMETAVYSLIYSEESLRVRYRRGRQRVLEQSENLLVFADGMASIPDTTRCFYPGTNRGKAWGQIALEPKENLWHLPWGEKEKAMGSQAIRAVGGRPNEDLLGDIVDEDQEANTPFGANSMVPFVWSGLPLKFFQELLHVNNPVGIIDFTPGDGLLALATLLRRGAGTQGGLVYVGLCHTGSHAVLLRNHLATRVLSCTQDPSNPLYQLQCVKASAPKEAAAKGGQKRVTVDQQPKNDFTKHRKDTRAGKLPDVKVEDNGGEGGEGGEVASSPPPSLEEE